jgi:hypothetical protein
LVLAAKEEGQPKLDQWDQMELKFGHLLGEDPKLTLAQVIAVLFFQGMGNYAYFS